MKTIKNFLQENPDTDALIINDVYLSVAHLATSELNIKVPEKLRIVVFDEEISFMEKNLIKPYIIKQDAENIGYFAANCVYNQIIGDKRTVSKKFPAKIINTEI